jgi:hypothetical protein
VTVCEGITAVAVGFGDRVVVAISTGVASAGLHELITHIIARKMGSKAFLIFIVHSFCQVAFKFVGRATPPHRSFIH